MRALYLAGVGAAVLSVLSASAFAQSASGEGPLGCLDHFKCEFQGACRLPCIDPGPDQTAAAPAPAAQPVSNSPASRSGPAKPPAIRPRPKPPALVTIAASEAEMAPLKALAAAVPAVPVKIVKLASRAGRPDADLAVKALVAPVAEEGPKRATKLFTEQIHVLAGHTIAALSGLSGRVVSFGPEGSAAQEAGRRAFAALGLKVQETPLDFANALDGLSTGDIDAVVFLAPDPFPELVALDRESEFRLLAWPEGASIPEGMLMTQIPAGIYPHLLQASVHVPGVEAVLTANARIAERPSTKLLFAGLAAHSEELSKRGFNLLKADLETKRERSVASNEKR